MMRIEKVNTWEVHIVLCLGFDSHGSVITPLIYSKHEISDCDRRCCQNIKHTLGGQCVLLFVLCCQKMVQGDGVILHKHNELKTSRSGPPLHTCGS